MKIYANFKTNHTRESTKEYISKLNRYNQEVILFLPYTAFDKYIVDVGAQNGYPAIKGSFTGEIGLEQLNEFNIKNILIGHSERRHIIGESQEFIAKKYKFFMDNGFKIVYCVGEPLSVREQGIDATIDYVKAQFEGIDLGYDNLVVAYEPVWAIGTGVSATISQIEQTHNRLREFITAPLLYGGSVNICSSEDIFRVPNVDGVLVGTVSWNVDDFSKIIEIASKVSK